MSITFILIFGGFLIAYAGVTNKPVIEVLRGNFDVPVKA